MSAGTTWTMTWTLALAALRQRPLRTFLTALGIAVAVGSTVVFLSLGEGLRRVFVDQLASIGPDIQLTYGGAPSEFFPTTPELPASYLATFEQERERFGLRSVTPVLLYLRAGLSATQSFVFEAFPMSVPLEAMFMNARVLTGRGLSEADEGADVVVVGVTAAERNGIELGEELRLNPQTRLEVVGIVGSDGGFLENVIIVPLATLQRAIGVEDRYSLLALDLERPEQAEAVAAAIREAYPEVTAQTQSDLLSVMRDALRISDAVRLGISAIALLVGAIAVANTMMMSVFERTREFGVVRAVGAKPRFLFGLVEAESVLLSLAGAAAGVGIGRLGVVAVNRVAENLVGLSVAAVTPRLVLFAALVALVMGLLSGLVPAARASRIPIAVAVARE